MSTYTGVTNCQKTVRFFGPPCRCSVQLKVDLVRSCDPSGKALLASQYLRRFDWTPFYRLNGKILAARWTFTRIWAIFHFAEQFRLYYFFEFKIRPLIWIQRIRFREGAKPFSANFVTIVFAHAQYVCRKSITRNGFIDSDFLYDWEILAAWLCFSPILAIFHCACAVWTNCYFRFKIWHYIWTQHARFYPNVTTLRSVLCSRKSACLSVCRLSVTFVRPTQGFEAFGNIFHHCVP